MGYVHALQVTIVDEDGKELGVIEFVSESGIEIEDHTFIDTTSDDDPEGARILMVQLEE